MGIGKKKEKEQPKPAPAKVTSRGVLLNKWAARQDKLQKLVAQVTEIKKELVDIAQLLHDAYGVLVQDSTHTVTLQPKATPDAPVAPASGEEGAMEPLPLEKNPLAKSPIPITVSQPITAPMAESAVEKIRQDSQLEGGGEQDVAQIAATALDRIVRQGLGK